MAWAEAGVRLDEADVVGGDAVEAVGVIDLAGVRRRRLCCGGLPERVGAAVVGDVDVVAGDAGAGAVGTGPGDREARGGRGCGERGDGARRRAGVDRVGDLRRGDRGVGVEDDARLGVERRAGGEASLGLDCVVDVAFAVGRIGVGREEAEERVRGRVEGIGVQ